MTTQDDQWFQWLCIIKSHFLLLSCWFELRNIERKFNTHSKWTINWLLYRRWISGAYIVNALFYTFIYCNKFVFIIASTTFQNQKIIQVYLSQSKTIIFLVTKFCIVLTICCKCPTWNVYLIYTNNSWWIMDVGRKTVLDQIFIVKLLIHLRTIYRLSQHWITSFWNTQIKWYGLVIL